MFIAASTIILLVIALGIFLRKKHRQHMLIMILAFILDVSLVLAIEFNRSAINTAIEQATQIHNAFVLFHITVSLLVVVLYLALMYTGSKVMKLAPIAPDGTKTAMFKLHSKLAYAFIILRLINYVTSFRMFEQVNL